MNKPTAKPPEKKEGVSRRTLIRIKAKTFAEVYPLCIALKFSEPHLSRKEIALTYCEDCHMTSAAFMARMRDNGWADVEKRLTSSRQANPETTDLIGALSVERKQRGVKHLDKLMGYIDDAHETIGTQVEADQEDRKEAAKRLPEHLSNLDKIEKIGAKVFGLQEEKEASSPVINLAILANFDPTKRTY